MDDGSIIPSMVMYGHPISVPIFNHTVAVATGYGQMIMNGCGFQITVGVGRHFTTVDGFTILFTDGCGCLDTNGHLRGFHGEQVAIITDGPP